MSADVTTILEGMRSQLQSSSLDSVLSVSVESVQLEPALDHL